LGLALPAHQYSRTNAPVALTTKMHLVYTAVDCYGKDLPGFQHCSKNTGEEVKSSALVLSNLCYPVSAAQLAIIYLPAFFCFNGAE